MAVETLVVLGYGPVEAGAGLNVYARLAALAAGTLLERGEVRQLLLTGGKTGGDDLPSEAALMSAYLTRHVGLASPNVLLEEHARDTLENIVFSANLLDESGFGGTLGFLALQMHLPRVRYLADLVGLAGETFALKPIIAARSARHKALLERLKQTPSYAHLAASQVRAMRGLKTLPEFWLPPLARLESPARLRRVQSHPAVRKLGLPEDVTDFQNALRATPRRYPEPQPDDKRHALELIHA